MRAILAAASLLVLAAPVLADSYPSKPITLIVPLAAGSTADILARTLGQEMSKALGQNIVVDDRPTAGGTLAMEQLARAAPDGYTIGIISQGTHVFNVGLYPKLGYDPVKSFAPITLLSAVTNVMVVPPNSRYTSVAEIMAAAKAAPDTITFSSGGNGTSHHMSGVLFAKLSNTALSHVPYRGAPQGVAAVMQGEVAMGFYNMPSVIAQIKDAKLKPLAVTSLGRSSYVPDVPTLDASGLPGYEVVTWTGIAAPAGTPPEITARWRSELIKVLADPAVRAKMVDLGFDVMEQLTPEAFTAFLEADLKKWVPIVKASGATVD